MDRLDRRDRPAARPHARTGHGARAGARRRIRAHGAGQAGPEVRRRRIVACPDGRDDVVLALLIEEAPPHQHLPQHRAHGEEIGAPVEGLGVQLLRRHVAELALHDARAGHHALHLALGHAEVAQLRDAALRDEDVHRRDVAVDELERGAVVVGALVGVVQPREDVAGDVQRVLQRDRPPHGGGVVDHPAQRGAADELHGDEVGALLLAEVVDLHDVRVVEEGLHAGLVEEHGLDLAIADELLGDALDDEVLLEPPGPELLAEEDLGHAARREQLRHLVGTDPLSHGVERYHARATSIACPIALIGLTLPHRIIGRWQRSRWQRNPMKRNQPDEARGSARSRHWDAFDVERFVPSHRKHARRLRLLDDADPRRADVRHVAPLLAAQQHAFLRPRERLSEREHVRVRVQRQPMRARVRHVDALGARRHDLHEHELERVHADDVARLDHQRILERDAVLRGPEAGVASRGHDVPVAQPHLDAHVRRRGQPRGEQSRAERAVGAHVEPPHERAVATQCEQRPAVRRRAEPLRGRREPAPQHARVG